MKNWNKNCVGDITSICPVKKEILQPFWATNSRGETLALMNVAPFAQYVYVELCRFEKKEMLCKKGCRCEQQYGLQRLLAYDPNNECRGVFAEWFRFPSLCICKCYNKPENWWEDLLPDPADNSETDVESELDEVEEVLEEIEGEQVLEALPEALPLTADTSDIPATSRAKKKLGRKWTPGIITRALFLIVTQIFFLPQSRRLMNRSRSRDKSVLE